MSEREVLLQISDLCKDFKVRSRKLGGTPQYLHALSHVSLDVYRGETLGVIGESGCGKSTLGRCVVGLHTPTGGSLRFEGAPLDFKAGGGQGKALRRKIQMIFQDPYSSLDPRKTCGRIVEEPMIIHKTVPDRAQREERVRELMSVVGLDAQHVHRFPHEFSGGQRQRINIARALSLNPGLLVCDEPVSALDVSIQAQVLNLILDLRARYHQTMMFISHDLPVVEHICDRVIVMYLGAVMELGRTPDLFDRTTHPYTMALLASKPKDHPDAEKPAFELTGDVPSALHMPAGCRFHPRCPYARKGLCDTTQPPLQEVGSGHFAACHLAAEIRSHAD